MGTPLFMYSCGKSVEREAYASRSIHISETVRIVSADCPLKPNSRGDIHVRSFIPELHAFSAFEKGSHSGGEVEWRSTGPQLGVETVRIVRLLSLET